MNFVTKKQFEDAVAIIQNALDSGQVEDGHNHELLSILRFALTNKDGSIVGLFKFNAVQFIPPDMAIKNKLQSLRNELKISKEGLNKSQRDLSKLESEEQALAALLAKTKE